ncbi:hypothetical protein AVEN_74632-1 [Araneus ventricosus]|uniref:Uncharacterized protein n=1 Tax=Araneus ventricosus TaxID=182803 RepID=A0A4Y2KC55_ARAVE|nr:hypothetical protein AVEN_74632-1 [Araneus ventricosus]
MNVPCINNRATGRLLTVTSRIQCSGLKFCLFFAHGLDRLRVLLNVSTNQENFLLIFQNGLSEHTAQLYQVCYKNRMDVTYYANEDGRSYLFTRDYYYKKDVSAELYFKAEGYGKI